MSLPIVQVHHEGANGEAADSNGAILHQFLHLWARLVRCDQLTQCRLKKIITGLKEETCKLEARNYMYNNTTTP